MPHYPRWFFDELADLLERFDATIHACHGSEIAIEVKGESYPFPGGTVGEPTAREQVKKLLAAQYGEA